MLKMDKKWMEYNGNGYRAVNEWANYKENKFDMYSEMSMKYKYLHFLQFSYGEFEFILWLILAQAVLTPLNSMCKTGYPWSSHLLVHVWLEIVTCLNNK